MRADKILAVFLILAVFSLVVSADWVEWLKVKVVDATYKPAPDVEVVVNYQKNDYYKRDATEKGFTDRNGEYAVLLRNVVPELYEDEFYSIKVNPAYESVNETRARFGDNRISGAHVEIFTLTTVLNDLRVNLTDQKGQRLAGAEIMATPPGYTRITDDKGAVLFRLPSGQYSITATYGNFETESSLALSADTWVEMSVFIYNATVSVFVLDEKGVPFSNATVTFECPGSNPCIGDQTKVHVITGDDGAAVVREVLANETNVTVNYGGITRSRRVLLGKVDEVREVFVLPREPLVVGNISISSSPEPCAVTVTADLNDERDPKANISASLMYSIDGGEWLVALNTLANSTYIFEISNCTPPFGMNYSISAKDEFGSHQTPKFEFFMAAPFLPIVVDGGGQNATDDGEPWWAAFNIPVDFNVVNALFMILGSIILLSFVIITTFIYRDRIGGLFTFIYRDRIGGLFRGNIFHRLRRKVQTAEEEYLREKESMGGARREKDGRRPSELPDDELERRIEEAKLRAAKTTGEAKREEQAKAAPAGATPQKPEARQAQPQAPQQARPPEQPEQQASPPAQQPRQSTPPSQQPQPSRKGSSWRNEVRGRGTILADSEGDEKKE
ncbi:MAG: hypothetical protein NT157_06210 [Candidatus Micrarchaeota archaeon]|nr:hypothetical protein [Candidatus Micrarchaeota archaeon]